MKYIDEIKYPPQFLFSGKYGKICELLYKNRGISDGAANSVRADKKLVKEIWSSQKIERRGVKTVDGDRIFVISPGEWNFDSGPDFRNARININGTEIGCDVAVGVYSSDIKNTVANGKSGNQILNVFLRQGRPAPAAAGRPGRQLYSLELKNYVDQDLDFLESGFDIEDYPTGESAAAGKCAASFAGNYPLLDYITGLAGDERIIRKSRTFAKMLGRMPLSDVIYRGLMDGLGYGPNRANFGVLCEKLPLGKIKDLTGSAGENEKFLVVQAVLFGTAGLIPGMESRDTQDDEAGRYISKIREIWRGVSADVSTDGTMDSKSWKFGGLRPFNFPYRRIAAASFIISKYGAAGLEKLFYNFYNGLKENRLDPKKFYRELKFNEAAGADFWSSRTTFYSRPLKKPVAYIGEERVSQIIVNTFLPVALALNEDSAAERNIYGWWEKLPACSLNRITKYASKRIGFGNAIDKERSQQGLMQLFRDYCDTKKGVCAGCAFRNISGLPASVFFNN